MKPLISGTAAPAGGRPVFRICIVVPEADGPNGIAAVRRTLESLAESLAQAGQEVTVLTVPGANREPAESRRWLEWGAVRAIRIEPLPIEGGPRLIRSAWMGRSFQAFEWLKDRGFDAAHFAELGGVAFYSVGAKHQGLAFAATRLAVHRHSRTLDQRLGADEYVVALEELELEFMERESVRLADAAVGPAADSSRWIPEQEDWTAHLNRAARTGTGQPLVSVCLTHYNRPAYLRQALASIEAQDYLNHEIVLVDDASTMPEAIDQLRVLEASFHTRGWTLIRNQENLFPGAARNLAAQRAKGEYILFMDDDNVAKPHAISTFVGVAQRTGAEIVSCTLDMFSGEAAPDAASTPTARMLFLGGAVSAGAFSNYFGDTNSLFRRDVFLKLGGFHEHKAIGFEDWKLLGDAVLRGYRLETISDALVWYRRHSDGQHVGGRIRVQASHHERLQPYLDAVPPAMRPLVLYAQGMWFANRAAKEKASPEYAAATRQWRMKLEAGLAVVDKDARLGAELMLQAIGVAEKIGHPGILLDAIIDVAPRLGPLDPEPAKGLLRRAIEVAGNYGCANEKLAAQRLLATMGSAS